MMTRRDSAAALRFAERRQRENDAPRLREQVPGLKNLKLDVEELCGQARTRHIRRIVVDRAPAMFLVPCGDPRCTDGEHDLTLAVMRGLRARETSFGGTDECTGGLGSAFCARILNFTATAEYETGTDVESRHVRVLGPGGRG